MEVHVEFFSVLWRHVVLCTYISKDRASSVTSPCRWRQQGSPKRSYPTTSLHCITTKKTATLTFIAEKIASVALIKRLLNKNNENITDYEQL
jgi:hypothetical protein